MRQRVRLVLFSLTPLDSAFNFWVSVVGDSMMLMVLFPVLQKPFLLIPCPDHVQTNLWDAPVSHFLVPCFSSGVFRSPF